MRHRPAETPDRTLEPKGSADRAERKVLDVVTRKNRIPDPGFDAIVGVSDDVSDDALGQTDPAGVAVEQAGDRPHVPRQRGGWCTVCGRPLRSEQSVAIGMGPVCAGKAR